MLHQYPSSSMRLYPYFIAHSFCLLFCALFGWLWHQLLAIQYFVIGAVIKMVSCFRFICSLGQQNMEDTLKI